MNLFGDIFSADKTSRDPSSTGRLRRISLDNPPQVPFGEDATLEWVDFSQTLNPLGTPMPIRRAMHNVYHGGASTNEDELFHELPLLIARRLGVSADNVAVGASIESILGIIASVMKPCTVGITKPSRSGYGPTFKTYGHELVEIPNIDGFAVPEPQTIESYGVHFDGVMLANPSYPSSRLLPFPTLSEYCEAYSWVVLDERGVDLSLSGESMVPHVSKYPNLIVLQSFTDTFAIPDISLAYCVASPQIIHYIEQLIKKPESITLAHAVAKEALNLNAYLDNTHELLDSEIPWMQCKLSLLPGMTIYPAEANYVLCCFNPGANLRLGARDLPDLVEKLQTKGFLVRALDNTPGLDKSQYFCVAVKTRKQNEQLVSAMREILTSRPA